MDLGGIVKVLSISHNDTCSQIHEHLLKVAVFLCSDSYTLSSEYLLNAFDIPVFKNVPVSGICIKAIIFDASKDGREAYHSPARV